MFKFLVKGVVQGVGFRPYIYRECVKAGIKGYIQNTGQGVVIVADDAVKVTEILKHAPPLSRIDSSVISETDATYHDFTIKESEGSGFSEIPPDLYLCEDCLKELHDSKDRRYKYFFTTCTSCGPRFSITWKTPYDRDTTSMSAFGMCQRCSKEYADPGDRRYHAQTIACHDCGPKLSFVTKGIVSSGRPIERCAKALNAGEVVSIKGIGGFHLACIQDSVQKLRELTGRPDKPYALMCRDMAMARNIAQISSIEEKELLSAERPIVVLRKIREFPGVSELDTIGIMLPYSAHQYLLFDHIDQPLVMTSSNYPDEPITTGTKQQMAESILAHDRKIVNRIDDSVVKIIDGKRLFLRRSRGFVPQSLRLAAGKLTALALGAEMSNTFAVLKDGDAIMSQYMGTLSNLSSFENYKRMIARFLKFTDAKPDVILADLHPEYNTSVYGRELAQKLKIPLVPIQHHRAHAYSVAAEHGLASFSSVVCDGLGYGDDGTIWGGEVFDRDERIGHLEHQHLPGGDAAARHPWRMLLGILIRFMEEKEIHRFIDAPAQDIGLVIRQIKSSYNAPRTSSCGRILDAASYLLGFCRERTYEGRPAMLLEAYSGDPYSLDPVIEGNVLMTTPLFRYLVMNLQKDKRRLAATVQRYIAEGLYQIAKKSGRPIVFSGGCAYSRIMTSYMVRNGVFVNEKVPPGDGGISFGQLAYYVSADPWNNVP